MSELWSVTVPGYATGAGTVLLVIVTGTVIISDRHKEARRERQEALRDARKVFAIAEREPVASLPGNTLTTFRDRLTIINASADPIYDAGAGALPIRATQPFWSPAAHQLSIPYMLAGERRSLYGEWQIHSGDGTADGPKPLPEQPDWIYAQMRVTVTWTDGRGITWSRVRSDEPTRIEE